MKTFFKFFLFLEFLTCALSLQAQEIKSIPCFIHHDSYQLTVTVCDSIIQMVDTVTYYYADPYVQNYGTDSLYGYITADLIDSIICHFDYYCRVKYKYTITHKVDKNYYDNNYTKQIEECNPGIPNFGLFHMVSLCNNSTDLILASSYSSDLEPTELLFIKIHGKYEQVNEFNLHKFSNYLLNINNNNLNKIIDVIAKKNKEMFK